MKIWKVNFFLFKLFETKVAKNKNFLDFLDWL